jgi:S1-C subfamily serine protease
MENFRNLFRICLLTFLIGGCCSGTIANEIAKFPNEQEINLAQKRKIEIEKLRQTTIAIIDKSQGVNIPVCTGVWIGKSIILTAAHCVNDELIIHYSTPDDYDNDKTKTATVVAVDNDIDLALLLAPSDGTNHPVSIISTEITSSGDDLDIIGHPVGYAWTYMKGNVSAVRELRGPIGKEKKVFQASAPVWMGVSGGGAFDHNGNLVGICSWVSKNGPNLAFFIHKEEIERFLLREYSKLATQL